MNTFQALVKKLNDVKIELKAEGEKAFLFSLQEFMDAHPEVAVFGFHQSTPSFNDGDPCYNYLCGPYILLQDDLINGGGKFHVSDLDEDHCSRTPDSLKEEMANLTSEDALELIFGTNTKFIAQRNPTDPKKLDIVQDYYDCGY